MGVEGELCSAKALCLTLTQCSQGILLLVSTTDAQQHDICFKSGSSVIWVVSSNHLHRYSNACCSCFFPWHFVFLELAKKVGTWTQMHRKHTHTHAHKSSVMRQFCLTWTLFFCSHLVAVRGTVEMEHSPSEVSIPHSSAVLLQPLHVAVDAAVDAGGVGAWGNLLVVVVVFGLVAEGGTGNVRGNDDSRSFGSLEPKICLFSRNSEGEESRQKKGRMKGCALFWWCDLCWTPATLTCRGH